MDLTSRTVFLERSPDYREIDLLDIFDKILIPCIPAANLTSMQVLLKPNLISSRMGTLPCTEGTFIQAAAKWFLDRNARVAVGDSPAFGTAAGALRRLGIADELRRLSVSIVDFKKVRTVTLPSGLRAGMAASAMDCDLLVNMPRVKAHAQFRVTLGVKNLFGCLVGMRKPLWHMIHGGREGRFADHLVEFLSVLPSGVTLVDGITAMHRTGPIGGQSFPLGIAASSNNPVAVDRALLAVLGIEPDQSPLMRSCSAMGMTGTDLANLNFPLLCPEELAVNSFAVPGALHPVRFSLLRFMQGNLRRVVLKLGSVS